MYQQLREELCNANCKLAAYGLATSTWGNVSGIDRQAGAVAIKPSGVPYDELTADKIVVLDLDGNQLYGDLEPSSDTPTHLELYRSFKSIGGICHTHSLYATIWAQACRALPCYGTTHADYFHGEVPLTEALTPEEIEDDYEINTGRVIVRRFSRLSVEHVPAVLVAHHGPFTWGPTPVDAVDADEYNGRPVGAVRRCRIAPGEEPHAEGNDRSDQYVDRCLRPHTTSTRMEEPPATCRSP